MKFPLESLEIVRMQRRINGAYLLQEIVLLTSIPDSDMNTKTAEPVSDKVFRELAAISILTLLYKVKYIVNIKVN